mgnify:CR=1 FL=1
MKECYNRTQTVNFCTWLQQTIKQLLYTVVLKKKGRQASNQRTAQHNTSMDPDEIAIQLQQQSNPLLIVEEQHSPPTTEQHPPALLQIPSQDRSFKPNRYQYRLHPSTVSSRVQRLFTSPHSRSALQQALQDAGTADSRSFAHCDLAHHLVPRTSVPVQCKLPGGHTVLGVDFVNQGGDPGGAPNLRIFANLEAQPQHRGEQQLLLQQRDVNGATAGEQNLNLRSASFLLYRAPLETSYRAELGSQVLRNRKISFYAMLLVHLLITLYLQFINRM